MLREVTKKTFGNLTKKICQIVYIYDYLKGFKKKKMSLGLPRGCRFFSGRVHLGKTLFGEMKSASFLGNISVITNLGGLSL